MTIQNPQKLYDFTSFSQTRPNQQPPGDRIDAQFENHASAIQSLIETFTTLQSRQVTATDLDPALLTSFLATIGAAASAEISAALQHANEARSFSEQSLEYMRACASALARVELTASEIVGIAPSVVQAIRLEKQAAEDLVSRANDALPKIDNAENDALLAAATAQDWADVSIHWAEYLPGPIPGNILAISGVSGDHWSSRWWSNQASILVQDAENLLTDMDAILLQCEAARDAAIVAKNAAEAALDSFTDLYLGAGPINPTLDHDGNVLQAGALFFNTSTPGMYVWSGTQWNLITNTSGAPVSAASGISVVPAGNISSTNVQAALQELDTEKTEEAPNDGGTYGRKNKGWISVLSPTTDWGNITGKPSTFPPSPHAHPISDVTGLQAELDNRATDAELSSEAATRASADTTLQTNINTVSTNLATETTNRIAADAALQADVNTRLQDAPSDGSYYGRLNATWGKLTSTAAISIAAPASPVPGQMWWDSDTGNFYVYYNDGNSSQWVQVNARQLAAYNMFTQDAPPASPPPNALWYESDTGNLYVWYNDGNSSQWVQINYAPDTTQLNKFAQLASRTNILFNGDFSFSQKAGYAAVSANSAYFADGWYLASTPPNASAKVIGRSVVAFSALQKGRYRAQYACITQKTSLAATDLCALVHHIEGMDMSPLGWGLANGTPAVLRFGFKGPAGSYSCGIFDDTATNFWCAPFTITAAQANTDTIQVFSVPPPPLTGLWVAGNVKAATLRIGLAAGATFTGAMTVGGAWGVTNILMPNGGFNFFSSTSNVVEVFDVKLVGDNDGLAVDPGFAPTDFASEYARCQRYYQTNIFNGVGYTAAGSSLRFPMSYPVTMRANPVGTVLGTVTYSNASAAVVTLLGPSGCVAGFTVTALGNGTASFTFELDANLT